METTADRTVKHDVVPVELKDITELREKIEYLEGKFNFLFAHVQTKTPPWPKTQFEQSPGIRRARRQLRPDDARLGLEFPPRAFQE